MIDRVKAHAAKPSSISRSVGGEELTLRITAESIWGGKPIPNRKDRRREGDLFP
jgi:hypothetical protein